MVSPGTISKAKRQVVFSDQENTNANQRLDFAQGNKSDKQPTVPESRRESIDYENPISFPSTEEFIEKALKNPPAAVPQGSAEARPGSANEGPGSNNNLGDRTPLRMTPGPGTGRGFRTPSKQDPSVDQGQSARRLVRSPMVMMTPARLSAAPDFDHPDTHLVTREATGLHKNAGVFSETPRELLDRRAPRERQDEMQSPVRSFDPQDPEWGPRGGPSNALQGERPLQGERTLQAEMSFSSSLPVNTKRSRVDGVEELLSTVRTGQLVPVLFGPELSRPDTDIPDPASRSALSSWSHQSISLDAESQLLVEKLAGDSKREIAPLSVLSMAVSATNQVYSHYADSFVDELEEQCKEIWAKLRAAATRLCAIYAEAQKKCVGASCQAIEADDENNWAVTDEEVSLFMTSLREIFDRNGAGGIQHSSLSQAGHAQQILTRFISSEVRPYYSSLSDSKWLRMEKALWQRVSAGITKPVALIKTLREQASNYLSESTQLEVKLLDESHALSMARKDLVSKKEAVYLTGTGLQVSQSREKLTSLCKRIEALNNDIQSMQQSISEIRKNAEESRKEYKARLVAVRNHYRQHGWYIAQSVDLAGSVRAPTGSAGAFIQSAGASSGFESMGAGGLVVVQGFVVSFAMKAGQFTLLDVMPTSELQPLFDLVVRYSAPGRPGRPGSESDAEKYWPIDKEIFRSIVRDVNGDSALPVSAFAFTMNALSERLDGLNSLLKTLVTIAASESDSLVKFKFVTDRRTGLPKLEFCFLVLRTEQCGACETCGSRDSFIPVEVHLRWRDSPLFLPNATKAALATAESSRGPQLDPKEILDATLLASGSDESGVDRNSIDRYSMESRPSILSEQPSSQLSTQAGQWQQLSQAAANQAPRSQFPGSAPTANPPNFFIADLHVRSDVTHIYPGLREALFHTFVDTIAEVARSHGPSNIEAIAHIVSRTRALTKQAVQLKCSCRFLEALNVYKASQIAH